MATAVDVVLRVRREGQQALTALANELGGLGSLAAKLGAGTGVFGAIVVGAVAAGGAMVAMGKALADQVEQLDRLSTNTGVSAERLQVMQQVMREGGGDAEGLATSLAFLNRAIANQDPLLAKLGITTKDVFSAYIQLGTALAGSEDSTKKNAIALKLLGKASADSIVDVQNMPSAFGQMDAAMRRSGGLITNEMVPSLRLLDHEFDAFGRNWAGMWQKARVASAGHITWILFDMNRLFDAVNKFGQPTESGMVKELVKLQAHADDLRKSLAAGAGGQVLWLEDQQRELGTTLAKVDRLKGAIADLHRPVPGEPFGPPAPKDLPDMGPEEKKKKAAGPSEREKSILSLMKTLAGTRAQAELLFESLEKVELAKKRADLMKQFPSVFENFNAPPEVTADTEGSDAILNTLTERYEAAKDAAEAAAKATLAATREITSAMENVAGEFGAGIGGTVSDLISGVIQAQTVVLAVLQSIRIAIAHIIGAIVQQLAIFGILSAFGAAPAGGIGKFILKGLGGASASPAPVGGGRSAREAASSAPQQAGDFHMHVNALDVRSVVDAYRSQSGALRQAARQMSGPQEGWA